MPCGVIWPVRVTSCGGPLTSATRNFGSPWKRCGRQPFRPRRRLDLWERAHASWSHSCRNARRQFGLPHTLLKLFYSFGRHESRPISRSPYRSAPCYRRELARRGPGGDSWKAIPDNKIYPLNAGSLSAILRNAPKHSCRARGHSPPLQQDPARRSPNYISRKNPDDQHAGSGAASSRTTDAVEFLKQPTKGTPVLRRIDVL